MSPYIVTNICYVKYKRRITGLSKKISVQGFCDKSLNIVLMNMDWLEGKHTRMDDKRENLPDTEGPQWIITWDQTKRFFTSMICFLHTHTHTHTHSFVQTHTDTH